MKAKKLKMYIDDLVDRCPDSNIVLYDRHGNALSDMIDYYFDDDCKNDIYHQHSTVTFKNYTSIN